MQRFKGIGSFLVAGAGVFALLRLVHLTLPVFFPQVLPGPFSLASLDEVSRHSGFSPLVPFYRPEILGPSPVEITVARRPRPKVVILWRNERFLKLTQTLGGDRSAVRPEAQPLPGYPGATWLREGRIHTIAVAHDRLNIELRSDLALQDLERILRTLRPLEGQR